MASRVGSSGQLSERGPGLLFRVSNGERVYPAFVVRVDGSALGYLNVCAHQGLRLNSDKPALFNRDGTLLQCMSHGAAYDPATGMGVRGPCQGLGLIRLGVFESEDVIFVDDETYAVLEEEDQP